MYYLLLSIIENRWFAMPPPARPRPIICTMMMMARAMMNSFSLTGINIICIPVCIPYHEYIPTPSHKHTHIHRRMDETVVL